MVGCVANFNRKLHSERASVCDFLGVGFEGFYVRLWGLLCEDVFHKESPREDLVPYFCCSVVIWKWSRLRGVSFFFCAVCTNGSPT